MKGLHLGTCYSHNDLYVIIMQEKKRKKVKEIRNYLKEIIVVKRTEIYETQITSKSRTLVRADVIYNLMLIKKKKKH